MMRVGKTSSSANQQQQQQQLQQQQYRPQQSQPLDTPVTRVNVRQNYNDPPVYQGSQSNSNRQQGTFNEFDENLNDVVQYGTECPPQGTGKFPYIMDCRQFLNCWKGRGYIQSCAPGTMFNSETSECDYPSKVKCGSVNEPATAARLESPNIQRVPKRIREPAVESRSGFDDPSQRPVDEVKCPRFHSGLLPHPVYCDKFLNCASGTTYIQDCGPGTVFNPIHMVCDWPHNVNCAHRTLYKDAQTSTNENGYVDQGQGSNQNNNNENFREGKYHGGEGQLDVRMGPEVDQQHQHQPRLNAQQYPIYTRPTTTTRNPNAINLPSQNLQPPPVPTTEFPRRAFGGKNNQQDQQQQHSTVNSWQLPWQDQQRRVSTTAVPLLQEPEFTPNYNRQYYNQMPMGGGVGVKANVNKPQQEEVDQQELPMSQALLLLMKPYLANSATRNNQTSDQAAMNWSTLMAQMATTTAKPELRISNEQENMNGGIWTPETNGNNDSDEAATVTSPMPPVPHGHSSDWHRRHPEVPIVRDGDNPHHIPHGHSADWHKRHPNVPMPGPGRGHNHQHHHHHHHRRNQTSHPQPPVSNDPLVIPLDTRFAAAASYQCAGKFDCNNTKCVEQDQVCDGKNDCGNRLDESNCEHIGYQVRLSNELGTTHEGRVEVKVYDQWGYVCDDKFGMRDAEVLCKELGFSLGASEVRGSSFYPANRKMKRNDHTVFMMDEMDCQGNEKSLSQCNFNGWGVHDCNEEEVVGVVCKLPVMSCPLDYWLCDTSQECIPTGFLCDNVPDCTDHSDENEKHCKAPIQMRLASGKNSLEGRVEINYRGIWGTVCDDDFGNKEAQVVCQSLGFYGPARVMKNKFGPGLGTIWLDQVNCAGNETSLEQCTHWHWGEHNCGHSEDVGVQCTAGEAPTTPRYGRSNGETIQYHNFDQNPRMPLMSGVERASMLQSDQCGRVLVRPRGQRNNVFKVVNGNATHHGHHPWQAALRVRGQGKSSHWCGAVLISRFHVLTAAHCLVGFPKGAYFIRFGDHDTDIEERTETEIFIENMYIHDDFRKDKHMNNDIALIVLKAPVRYSDYIQPVCLPQKNAMYFAGMNCTISGWGSIQSGKSSEYLWSHSDGR